MIKRVSKLNQFGIFRDFAWDSAEVDDFGRYNVPLRLELFRQDDAEL